MCMEQLHVRNVHGAVAEMCMEQLQKCAWSSSAARAEMCMEQLHVHLIRM